jgi:hypothetical protein
MPYDPLMELLTRDRAFSQGDPDFIGPVDLDDDTRAQVEQGWFSPQGHALQYKFLDGYRVGWKDPRSGTAGVVPVRDIITNDPGFADNPEVRRMAPVGSPLQAFGMDVPPETFGPQMLAPQREFTPGRNPQSAQPAGQQLGLPQAPTALPGMTPPQQGQQAQQRPVTLESVLSMPAVQQFLVGLGTAMGGGNPAAFGTQFGPIASGIVDDAAQSRYLAGLMSGRPVAELERELVGISPQGRERALTQQQRTEEMGLAKREQQRRERGTEADIRQGDTRLAQGERALGQADRELGMKERMIDLDRDKFIFSKDRDEFERGITERETQVKESLALLEQDLAESTKMLQRANAASAYASADRSRAEAQELRTGGAGTVGGRRVLDMQRIAASHGNVLTRISEAEEDLKQMRFDRESIVKIPEARRTQEQKNRLEAANRFITLMEGSDGRGGELQNMRAQLNAFNQELQSYIAPGGGETRTANGSGLGSRQSPYPAPKTAAELQRIPSGSWVIDPRDGKPKQKR